ncbi:pyranose dehydrogenase [Mycena rosella]|uniref:Pyranose dehydrogenase n=1 Tax=Mycena rosella TaxID=1033263 RepID=A0AAD7CW90_MYCRO|nr:pyranose dehydrogenase [Mycena rosella]
MLTPSFLLLSLFVAGGLGKLYEDVADLPGFNYDFVIAGGGTAGNVLANRLTENPNVSVLVLEAGVSNAGILPSEVPFRLGELFAPTVWNWNYTSTPGTGLLDRVLGVSRAHFLGGCSGHNGMVYTRGAAADFDRYAQITGDQGWSWNNIYPYFLKTENWSSPADHHNTDGQYNPALHGTNGPVFTSLNGYPYTQFEQNVIATTKTLPQDWPFNLDMNSGKPLGVGYLQSTIGNGERSTSATGYLAPQYIQRSNLHVLLHSQVSKLVNSTMKNGNVSFGGIQFKYGNSLYTAKAGKEIILSAGVIGSVQILQNSGIGPQEVLSAQKVPTLLNLPSVGKNGTDHPFFSIIWTVNSTRTYEAVTRNTTAFNEAQAQWNQSKTGPLVTSPLGTHIGWKRLPTNSSAFSVHADPNPNPTAPHLEFVFIPGGQIAADGNSPSGPAGESNFMTIGVALISPVSRGSVNISSSDPFAPPLIDMGFLTNEFDVLAIRDGIADAQKFVSQPAWEGYLGTLVTDLTPATLETTIRNTTAESYHYSGTNGMSAHGASYGVVNPDFLVKGVTGLSVIDGSTLPIIPAAHTQAVVYVFAERGADLVKKRWNL